MIRFGYLPLIRLTLPHVMLIGVLQLREITKVSQFFLGSILNSVLFFLFFRPDEMMVAINFLVYFVEAFSFVSKNF